MASNVSWRLWVDPGAKSSLRWELPSSSAETNQIREANAKAKAKWATSTAEPVMVLMTMSKRSLDPHVDHNETSLWLPSILWSSGAQTKTSKCTPLNPRLHMTSSFGPGETRTNTVPPIPKPRKIDTYCIYHEPSKPRKRTVFYLTDLFFLRLWIEKPVWGQ